MQTEQTNLASELNFCFCFCFFIFLQIRKDGVIYGSPLPCHKSYITRVKLEIFGWYIQHISVSFKHKLHITRFFAKGQQSKHRKVDSSSRILYRRPENKIWWAVTRSIDKKPTTLRFGKNGLTAKTQHLPDHYCVKAFLGAHTVDNMGQTVVSGRDINHSRGRHTQTPNFFIWHCTSFYRACHAKSWLAKPLLKWRMIRPHKTSRDRFDVV